MARTQARPARAPEQPESGPGPGSGSTRPSRDPFASPVELRLRSGERLRTALTARGHTELWVEVLHSGAGGLAEVVLARRLADGSLRMRRDRAERFIAAGDRQAVSEQARLANHDGLEAFATPATMARPESGNEAVGEIGSAWVDIDDPGQVEALRAFGRRPHLVVASGGSGGVHAYWRLAAPVAPARGEAANRALAEALGGDRQSANRGRIMRLAGTFNRKRRPARACRVVMCDLARPGYGLAELCAGLVDPKRRPPARGPGGLAGARDPYREIAAAAYFERLAGIRVPGSGLVSCPSPAHEDRNPSCSVGDTVWCCFGCGAGGSVYDLASALEGGPTGEALRGEQFRRARERVAAAFCQPAGAGRCSRGERRSG